MTYTMQIIPEIHEKYNQKTISEYILMEELNTITEELSSLEGENKLDFIDIYTYPPIKAVKKMLTQSGKYSTEEIDEITKATAALPGYRNYR